MKFWPLMSSSKTSMSAVSESWQFTSTSERQKPLPKFSTICSCFESTNRIITSLSGITLLKSAVFDLLVGFGIKTCVMRSLGNFKNLFSPGSQRVYIQGSRTSGSWYFHDEKYTIMRSLTESLEDALGVGVLYIFQQRLSCRNLHAIFWKRYKSFFRAWSCWFHPGSSWISFPSLSLATSQTTESDPLASSIKEIWISCSVTKFAKTSLWTLELIETWNSNLF